jgi:hypothetical protein
MGSFTQLHKTNWDFHTPLFYYAFFSTGMKISIGNPHNLLELSLKTIPDNHIEGTSRAYVMRHAHKERDQS